MDTSDIEELNKLREQKQKRSQYNVEWRKKRMATDPEYAAKRREAIRIASAKWRENKKKQKESTTK